ncbi:MAG: alpha/beta fold hydrolase [Acidimicrobiales bacterium]|nr:alpha/beta fold hydrolase [Acidimicrobiales bacterium]
MPTQRVRDLDLYHELHGDGPPLLMISGTGNDLRNSAPQLSPLNRRFTVCHYDQRGLGQTSKPAGPYTMADYADDAAALLDALGWDRVPVVGVSFGGMVAQNLVVRHPERVERLVLACTSPGGSGRASADLLAVSELPEDERAVRTLELLDTRYDPATGVLPPGLEPLVEAFAARSAAPLSDDAARGARLQLEARRGHDVYDLLPQVQAPTLVIGGRHDGIAPTANSLAIAEQIPGARLAVCDGGHVFFLQDPLAWPMIELFLTADL